MNLSEEVGVKFFLPKILYYFASPAQNMPSQHAFNFGWGEHCIRKYCLSANLLASCGTCLRSTVEVAGPPISATLH